MAQKSFKSQAMLKGKIRNNLLRSTHHFESWTWNKQATTTQPSQPLPPWNLSLLQTRPKPSLSLVYHSTRSLVKTGHGHSTVSRIESKHFPGLKKAVGGCPSKLSVSNIWYATQLSKCWKCCSSQHTAHGYHQPTPLIWKIRTALKKAGLKAVVKKKNPLLSPRHRRNRMDFVLEYQYWTLEDWKKVFFSDETKVNRLGSDGRKWAWKFPGEGVVQWWCGGVCPGMGRDHHSRLIAGWMGPMCWDSGGESAGKYWILGESQLRDHLSAGKWPQAYLKKGQSLVQWSSYPCPLMDSTVSWPQSNRTSLEICEKEAGRVWHTTKCFGWGLRQSGSRFQTHSARN